MFQNARITLTAWYLVIIMMISILFSVVIFNGINSELERFDRQQQLRQERIEHMFGDLSLPQSFPQYDSEIISGARSRLIIILGVINVGILLTAGVAGYFLARRTLLPIQNMVAEQHRFISDASHELRTPLTSLRTEIEVNLRDKTLSVHTAKKLLESNLEEVINLQNLSDNLLELSKAKVGKANFEPIRLAEVIEHTVKKMTTFAKRKNITISLHLGKECVLGEAIRLQQLFTILLDNAIKYSPKDTTITISMKKTERYVRVSITDQGIGIAKKDVLYIFDRFFRADKARGKKITGYGLGLSIAKKIVTEHTGTIQVHSNASKIVRNVLPETTRSQQADTHSIVGGGSTFIIQFPATKTIG